MQILTAGRLSKTKSILRRGFTLIELMVVIAILVIGMAVVLPWIDTKGSDTARGEAIKVVEMVTARARGTALLGRQWTRITFEEDALLLHPEELRYALPAGVTVVRVFQQGEGDERFSFIDISPRGIATPAVIHFLAESETVSLFIQPVLREVLQYDGEADFTDFIREY